MKKETIIKILVRGISLSIMLFGVIILFSPYGDKHAYNQKAIVVDTEINASASEVFRYLGDSTNASKWSTFVSSIETLNDCQVADGERGSKRRCFGKEQGIRWDEEILLIEPNKKRLLNVYNTKGFSMMADHLLTEQIYEPISKNKTRLKLSLFYKEGKRNIFSELKMYLGAYVVADIFEANLANIKKFNEQRQS